MAVVAPAPPGMVSCRHPCLCVACTEGVDDVAGVAILSLSARVKDPLPGWRSSLVGWLPRYAVCVDGCLLALSIVVVPRAAWLAHARCRAFGLLNGRLLDELLRLTVQVPSLGRRGCGHGP
jgi:hypothetical protein